MTIKKMAVLLTQLVKYGELTEYGPLNRQVWRFLMGCPSKSSRRMRARSTWQARDCLPRRLNTGTAAAMATVLFENECASIF